MFHEQDTVGRT